MKLGAAVEPEPSPSSLVSVVVVGEEETGRARVAQNPGLGLSHPWPAGQQTVIWSFTHIATRAGQAHLAAEPAEHTHCGTPARVVHASLLTASAHAV